MSATDVPSLTFVDPHAVDDRWRCCLYGAPGAGKTVAACSAPGPIIALSADRPGAYRYARRHHQGQQIHEARFTGSDTLRDLYEYARDNAEQIGTVVLDPWNTMYDQIVAEHTGPSGKPNWQKVNDIALKAVRSFRDLDVNLILVAHERREEDENGDTEAKIFPQLGGPALVQRIMAELDIVTRVFRRDGEDGASEWFGQLATARGYQCKDSSGALGRTRLLDLSEWIDTANAAGRDDESDLPWGGVGDPGERDEDPEDVGGRFDMDDARADAA